MEGAASPRETHKKKKRNPSLRRMLRNEGIDVPPVVQGVRDSTLPPKRKRNQKHPGKKRAKKIKTAAAAAAATAEANAPHVSAGFSAPGADSSDAGLPVVAPSPSSGISHTVSSSSATVSPPAAVPASVPSEPPQPAVEEADADNVVWDPVDPLGLFDELEGPLDWPSEGLFD
ncbi:unnamed protein product [Penicillium viridicatum]